MVSASHSYGLNVKLPLQTASLYPFTSRFLDIDCLRYHYIDEGPTVEPLLLVHGNPTWSFYYRHLIQAFRGERRVVAPDHIGCGMSEKPQDYPYVLAQHIANLERLVLTLDLWDITLAVHDWGGAIGFGMAVRHPERIRRMIIFNSAAFHSSLMPWILRVARLPVLGDLLIRGCNTFARLATVLALYHRERMTPEVRAGYLAPYDSWANRIATLRFVQDIPTSPRDTSYATLSEIEAGLTRLADRPVMLAWGMRDWVFTPAFLREWLRFYPNAEIHRMHDAAHFVVEDAHERIIPWMRQFLTHESVTRR